MFYNAVKKKGWGNVHEGDMVSTVAVHNAVNEYCWQKVMRWENMHKEYERKSTRNILMFLQ